MARLAVALLLLLATVSGAKLAPGLRGKRILAEPKKKEAGNMGGKDNKGTGASADPASEAVTDTTPAAPANPVFVYNSGATISVNGAPVPPPPAAAPGAAGAPAPGPAPGVVGSPGAGVTVGTTPGTGVTVDTPMSGNMTGTGANVTVTNPAGTITAPAPGSPESNDGTLIMEDGSTIPGTDATISDGPNGETVNEPNGQTVTIVTSPDELPGVVISRGNPDEP